MVNKAPEVPDEDAEKRREFLIYLASVPRVTREFGLDDEEAREEESADDYGEDFEDFGDFDDDVDEYYQ